MQKQLIRPKRRGVAPLELVMAIPVIVLLCALIWSLAFSGIDRCWVLAETRHRSWKSRVDPAADPGGTPLSAIGFTDFQQGQLTGEVHRTVTTAKVFGDQGATVGRSAFLVGEWDHRKETFSDSTGPHFGVLKQMALGKESDVADLNPLDNLLGFSVSTGDIKDNLAKGAAFEVQAKNIVKSGLTQKIKQYKQLLKPLEETYAALNKDYEKLKNVLDKADGILEKIRARKAVEKIEDKIDAVKAQIDMLVEAISLANEGLDNL